MSLYQGRGRAGHGPGTGRAWAGDGPGPGTGPGPLKKGASRRLLGPKGNPFKPKIKENMKNEKPSKPGREKRF